MPSGFSGDVPAIAATPPENPFYDPAKPDLACRPNRPSVLGFDAPPRKCLNPAHAKEAPAAPPRHRHIYNNTGKSRLTTLLGGVRNLHTNMGLFGNHFGRIRRAYPEAAVEAIRPICNQLEELQDTPNEYLILQAAGMAVGLQFRIAPPDAIADVSRGELLATDWAILRAHQILQAQRIDREVSQTVVERVHQTVKALRKPILAQAVTEADLVSCLDDYLCSLEREHLPRFRSQ